MVKLENKFKIKKDKIGILGGTFDPAHKGHVAISKEAIKKFKLKSVIWAITNQNPFKKKSFNILKKRVIFCKKIIGKNKSISQNNSQRSSQATSRTGSQNARNDLLNAFFRGLFGAGGLAMIAYIIFAIIRKLYISSKEIATKAINAKPKKGSKAYKAGQKTKKIFNQVTKSETEQLLDINDKYFEIALDEDAKYKIIRGQGNAVLDLSDGERVTNLMIARYISDPEGPVASQLRAQVSTEYAIRIDPIWVRGQG